VLVYETEPGQSSDSLTEAIPAGGTMRAFTPAPGARNGRQPVRRFAERQGNGRRVIAWLEEQRCRQAARPVQTARLAGVAPALLGHAHPDHLLAKTAASSPFRSINCPSRSPTWTTTSRPDRQVAAGRHSRLREHGCPRCGGLAERETDTMAGSVDSSWYFLRFTSPNEKNAAWDRASADYWMNVDRYIGGREHAVGHLLYARFWTKVFFDAGLVSVDEPFQTLRNQGSLNALTPIVKGTDRYIRPDELDRFTPDQIDHAWLRMSKTRGNGVTPDEIAEKYGADTLRLYVLFVAPFEDTIQWNETP
jgi:leucyl-tRNA synthetase